MTKLRVECFAISIDGYGAGPNQDLQNPLGISGPELMEWFFHTRVWRRMHGDRDGEAGVDNGIAEQGLAGIGAWILGRNMFGPVRGPWPDDSWKGWWGDEPPYHTPVFVLTHHPRAPLAMAGGTEFRFVTGGIHAALEQATSAAGDRDVRLGGGVATIRQYLRASLIDELHLAIRPVLLGSGEHLLNDIDVRSLGYECTKSVAGERGKVEVAPNSALEARSHMPNAAGYSNFAKAAAYFCGRPRVFVLAVGVIAAWIITGPIFSFSDTWQLVINTGTTIVTFLMVFLIQNTQNRDTEAIQVKLDELIRATKGAHNALLDLEELGTDELDAFRAKYQALACAARAELGRGLQDIGTPEP